MRTTYPRDRKRKKASKKKSITLQHLMTVTVFISSLKNRNYFVFKMKQTKKNKQLFNQATVTTSYKFKINENHLTEVIAILHNE